MTEKETNGSRGTRIIPSSERETRVTPIPDIITTGAESSPYEEGWGTPIEEDPNDQKTEVISAEASPSETVYEEDDMPPVIQLDLAFLNLKGRGRPEDPAETRGNNAYDLRDKPPTKEDLRGDDSSLELLIKQIERRINDKIREEYTTPIISRFSILEKGLQDLKITLERYLREEKPKHSRLKRAGLVLALLGAYGLHQTQDRIREYFLSPRIEVVETREALYKSMRPDPVLPLRPIFRIAKETKEIRYMDPRGRDGIYEIEEVDSVREIKLEEDGTIKVVKGRGLEDLRYKDLVGKANFIIKTNKKRVNLF